MHTEADSEKGNTAENPTGGYERLGNLMGEVPNAAIFRRFASLSAQNLLHLQAKICQLEADLAAYQEEDRQAGAHTDREKYDKNSYYLQDSIHPHDCDSESDSDGASVGVKKNDPRQWETILSIRKVLDEYYATLLQHHKIVNLKSPNKEQLKNLQMWMQRETMGNMYLTGIDSGVWDTDKVEELVTLESENSNGDSTSQSTVKLVNLYHDCIGRYVHRQEKDGDHLHNTVIYKNDGVERVVRSLKTLVACMLPIIGIVVLHLVKSMEARLGIIAGFTAIFSLTLCFLTTAGTKDIFSATAAFSAVLVVFVGVT